MVAFEPVATLSLWLFLIDLCIQVFSYIQTSVAESSFGSSDEISVLTHLIILIIFTLLSLIILSHQ